jgi:ketosteroid isomerase-like protein
MAGETTENVIARFSEAVNAHDLAEVGRLLTDDTLFENTFPPPDGSRYEGRDAVLGFWDDFFTSSPGAHFVAEESIYCGERAVVRWIYTWHGADSGHVRGVDVFRVRDGRVAEKLSYVKG